jgi:hypothetical protein
MKKILILALLVLVFLASGISAAKVPNILGNWTGLGTGFGPYAGEDGSSKPIENWSFNITIGEQKDRLFAGNMTYMGQNGTEIVEGFAGAIGPDNKAFYMAEYNEGYDIGTIISDDEIELIYLQDGEKGDTAIDRLHRIKA